MILIPYNWISLLAINNVFSQSDFYQCSKQPDKDSKDKTTAITTATVAATTASSEKAAADPPATPTSLMPPSTPLADIKSPLVIKEEPKEESKSFAMDEKKDEGRVVSVYFTMIGIYISVIWVLL